MGAVNVTIQSGSIFLTLPACQSAVVMNESIQTDGGRSDAAFEVDARPEEARVYRFEPPSASGLFSESAEVLYRASSGRRQSPSDDITVDAREDSKTLGNGGGGMAPPRGPKRNAIDYFNEGVALQKAGKLNEALEAYNKVFEVDPDVLKPVAHVLACLNIGDMFLKDNYFSGAAYTLRHALELAPDRLDARQNYAAALLALDRPYVAIRQYGIIIQREGAVRAVVEKAKGMVAEGGSPLVGLDSILDEIVESSKRTLVQLARHYEGEREYDLGNAAVSEVLAVEPRNEELMQLQQRILKELQGRQHSRHFNPSRINKLGRLVTRILRHAPWEYGLEVDRAGWVPLDKLLEALRLFPTWSDLTPEILERTIAEESGDRHEIEGGRARALYGHSIPGKVWREPAVPPEFLYHGTAKSSLDDILAEGLSSRKRQYVHLSTNKEDAVRIGKRKGDEVVILVIETRPLIEAGYLFFKGNENVWLTDDLPADVLGIDME